jgi:hypothetical protein
MAAMVTPRATNMFAWPTISSRFCASFSDGRVLLELKEGLFTATADPRKISVPPPAKPVPPFMNFAPLKNGVEAIKKSAERYQSAFSKWQAGGTDLPAQTTAALNAELVQIQRAFLTEKGLPERPWFTCRHKGNARAVTIPIGFKQGHYVTLCAA